MMEMKQNPHLPGTPEEFIESNLNLASSIAWKFVKVTKANPTGFDMDDIVSIAYYGLLKAYMDYDPTRFSNVNCFSTYAVPTIHGFISREIRDKNQLIRVKTRRVKELEQKANLSKRERETLACAKAATRIDSFNKPVVDKGKEITLGDTLTTEDDLTEVIVRDFYKSLNDREKKVYLMRCKCGLSQTEAGKRLGIAQVLVSRAERSMLDKARRYGDERMCC